MSDGEHDATLDRRYPLEASRRSPAQSPLAPFGAAPWERRSEAPPEDGSHLWNANAAEHGRDPGAVRAGARGVRTQDVGSHTSGVLSVADLIAKVGAPTRNRPRHHRLSPDTELPDAGPFDDRRERGEPDAAAAAAALQDTQVIENPAYSSDVVSAIPELGGPLEGYPGLFEDYPATAEPATSDADFKSAKTTVAAAPKPKRKRRRRPLMLAGRSMAALSAVLALVLTGGAWQWSTSKNARLNTISALDPNSRDIRDPGGQYGDEDFLIVGIDSRAGENADMGAGDTDDADGARSDTIMLVNIPANRKRVVAVSFPRDLAITPFQCEAWNSDTGKYGPIYDKKKGAWGPRMVYTETKLNSTFAFGGPKCLVKEIQKLSGLSINHFIAVDFAGFAKMVDAVGGVEVCTSTPLHDYELGTVLEHAGRQTLDGPTALSYVRARQVTTEVNGDYGRIKRQQLFLSSLLRSLISDSTLFDLNKLNNVVNMVIGDTYVDNVKTKDLLQLAQSLQGMAAGHFTFVTVPTGITDQNGDEPPRMDDMRALFDAIINDDPLPQENDHNAQNLGSTPTSAPVSGPTSATPNATKAPTPAPAPQAQREQVTTTSPQEVTVRVSNATSQSGLAASASSQLKRNGFTVMAPDDYPSSVSATSVLFSPGNEHAAATVAASFPNAKLQRVSGYGQVVQVVLGPDYNSVTAPPPSGSQVTVQVERGSANPPTKLPEDLTVTNAADTTCE
jgi:LCP family protein required for cell wall assembly